MSATPGDSTNGRGRDRPEAERSHSAAVERMRLSEFVRVSAPLVVPWTLQFASTYGLLFALARILGPTAYAEASAALSLALILSAAPVAFQVRLISASGPMAADATGPHRSAVDLGVSSSRSAVAVGAAVLVSTPAVSAALDLPLAPLALLAIAFVISLLSCARMRIVGGWRLSSAAIALGVGAVTRVAVGIVLALLGLGLAGIMLAIVIAESAVFAVGSYQRRVSAESLASRRLPRRTQLMPTIAAVGSVVLLTQVDLLFAHVRLEDVQAGRYAGAAAPARLLLFVPAIGYLLMTRHRARVHGDDPFHWLHRSLGFTGVSIVVLWLGLVLLRAPVTAIVLGPSFPDPSSLVPLLAGAAGCLAIVWQLSSFHIVVRSKAHSLLVATASAEVVALVLFATSAEAIAWIGFAAAGVSALLHYVGARAISRWSPPITRLRPHQELTTPRPHPLDGAVELSMIVPCYNPGPALEGFLARLIDELGDGGPNEIIVVSDGSTDDAVQIAGRFASPTVRVLYYAERSGKGHALRIGLSAARGSYVGFIDGDGEIDPRAIGPFLSLMRLYEPDIILGSKRHPMSVVSYPAIRRTMSWVYHKVTRILFRVNVRDTQTGLKVIRRAVLTDVLPRMLEKRYAFDLELLVVSRQLGFTKVFEAPVRIDYRFSSNVSPDAVFKILLDTAAVFYRRYILDTYRHAEDRLLLVREDLEGLDRESQRT